MRHNLFVRCHSSFIQINLHPLHAEINLLFVSLTFSWGDQKRIKESSSGGEKGKSGLRGGGSLPGASDGKEFTCNAGDLGSIPRLGRSPERGHSNPLQCSCLENPQGQRSLAGYSTGLQRAGHDWATKHGPGSLGHRRLLHCFLTGTKMKLAASLFAPPCLQILVSNKNISSLLPCLVCADCFASILPNPTNSLPSKSSQLSRQQGFWPHRGCLIFHSPARWFQEVKEAIPIAPPASQMDSHPFVLYADVPGPPCLYSQWRRVTSFSHDWKLELLWHALPWMVNLKRNAGLPRWSSSWRCTSNAGGLGLIPGWGTKIVHAPWYDK